MIDVLKTKYDFVFSLGAACSCTQALREAGLQQRSLPFDWIFGSDIVTRSRVLAGGTSEWFRKEDFVYVGQEWGKNVYHNTKTGLTYNHDFPLNRDIEETYAQVENKYARRSDRLLSCIRNSRHVLAVYLDHPTSATMISDEDLLESHRLLNAHFPGVTVNLLYIFNDDSRPYKNRISTKVGEGVHKLVFCYNAFNQEFPYLTKTKYLATHLVALKLSRKHLTFADVLTRLRKQTRYLRKRWMELLGLIKPPCRKTE